MARLPPLNAARAFEAAARHLSFTRAAEELHVSQGAISQQVKLLEDWLGRPLFRRRNRGLDLTEAGAAYAEAVRQGLGIIAEATKTVRRPDEAKDLALSCLASFAHKWLGPRLGRLASRHPALRLRILTGMVPVDLAGGTVDCAIRTGTGPYQGLYSEVLLTEELTPMARPDIAARLQSPEDLSGELLLRDFGTDWLDWLVPAGLGERDYRWGPEFLDSSMALDAAIAGQGIVLARTALAEADLAAGRLAAPFAFAVSYDWAHWFVCRQGAERRGPVRDLLDWLREEAGRLPKPEIRPGRPIPRLPVPRG